MSPLNAAICTTTYLERQKCYCPGKKILFKKQLFDLEVKGQGPTKVIMVCDTPPYGHAPTYQILFKKQLFDLEVNGQGPTKVIMVCDTPPYGHAPTYQISLTYFERQKCYGPDKKILFKKQLFDLEVNDVRFKYYWPIWKDKKNYGSDKLRWEEAEEEEEEKIRLKQYVSLHSKGRHNYTGPRLPLDTKILKFV